MPGVAAIFSLPERCMHQRRRGGGWSVGEVVGHVGVTIERYADSLDRVAGPLRLGSRRTAAAAMVRWFLGLPRIRLPAPPVFRPAGELAAMSRREFAARYLRFVDRLRELLRAGRGDARVPNPVDARIGLTVREVAALMDLHTRRHWDQIRRILAADARRT